MSDFQKIRIFCKEKNIHLSELADKVGISYTGLQKILNTNRTTVDTLEKIASTLDVPVSIFFDDSQQSTVNLLETSPQIQNKIYETELLKREIDMLKNINTNLEREITTLNARIKDKERFIEILERQLEDREKK